MFRIVSKKARPSVWADGSFWTELRWFHAFFVQHVCKILKNWTKKLPKSSEICNGEVDAINFQNIYFNIKSFLWNPYTLNCRTYWILEISIEKSSKRNSTTDSKMMRLMKWFVNFRCFAIFVFKSERRCSIKFMKIGIFFKETPAFSQLVSAKLFNFFIIKMNKNDKKNVFSR